MLRPKIPIRDLCQRVRANGRWRAATNLVPDQTHEAGPAAHIRAAGRIHAAVGELRLEKFRECSDRAETQPFPLERNEAESLSLQTPKFFAGVVAVPDEYRYRVGVAAQNRALKDLHGPAPAGRVASFGVRDLRPCAVRALSCDAGNEEPWAQIRKLRCAEFFETLRTVLDELEEDRQHTYVVEMLPRDSDQVELKVPHPRAVAERLFALDLLAKHQSLVDGGGKQAAVRPDNLPCSLQRVHRPDVISGLLMQQAEGLQRRDQALGVGAAVVP